MVVVLDDAASKGKSIAADRSGVNSDIDALIFSRSHSSQATCDIEFVTKWKMVAETLFDAVSSVGDGVVHPVPL